MIFLYLLIFALFVFIIADLFHGTKFSMIATLEQDTMKASITVLYPLFLTTVRVDSGGSWFSVYLLKMRLFTSKVKRKKKDSRKLAGALRIADIDLSGRYGFIDPSITGLVSGIRCLLFPVVCLRSFYLIPDFMAEQNYIHINASATIKVGHTILGYIKSK